MFAITHQAIPACIDEFAMYVGGEVQCTAYAPSGSAEVGVEAVKALEGRGAALLANHGLVAVGPDPEAALHITALVERSARITWGARILGPLQPLPADRRRDS
jgi:L-fuculose-phosphate aldolase